MTVSSEPGLYGIVNSNRSGSNLWGKNEFNSTFPIALCCYMRDNAIRPVYVAVNEMITSASDVGITIEDAFGTASSGNDIRFEFESTFDPYQNYCSDDLPSIDVISKERGGQFCAPIEIKLTVVPDSSTYRRIEDEWSAELVVRPVSSAYALLSLFDAVVKSPDVCQKLLVTVRAINERMQDWNNVSEVSSYRDDILSSLGSAFERLQEFQKPYLMQPIWKTQGKQARFADKCLDVFFWSNLAIAKLPLDIAQNETPRQNRVSRSLREAARHTRCLYSLLTEGRLRYGQVYGGMSLGNQTDKSFSVNGSRTWTYLRHPRLERPFFSTEVLKSLILNGGHRLLSPERRFDAAIYYTWND